MSGKIILLNGASSSGKSSFAAALQAEIELPFWHYSIDHLVAGKVLPSERIKAGEFPWKGMRESFFEGFHRSIPAFAQAGNNLIVEHIIETEEWMRRMQELLSPFDVFFVGIHCRLEVLERRELARGDRPVGDAKRDFETTHTFCTYDFEVDSEEPLRLSGATALEAWKNRPAPSALQRSPHNAKA